MDYFILGLLVLLGLFVVAICFLMRLLNIAVHQITDTNKQLLIVVAGKDEKPETLRALVASNKPPQGKLKGIATDKKKDKKPENTDYTMQVGVR